MLDQTEEAAFAEELEKFRVEYESGAGESLFRAIALCGLFDKPMPDWAVVAFIRSWSGYGIEKDSLDAAFNMSSPKGARLASKRRKLYATTRVKMMVAAGKNSGRAIDKELFDAIGAILGFSGSTVRDIYYSK